MKTEAILGAVLAGLALVTDGAAIEDAVFESKPGEEWQLDWSWRERKMPRTAFVRPFLQAWDADGKSVYSQNVGVAQQSVYDPKDLSVHKWRIYASIAAGPDNKAGTRSFTSLARITLPHTTRRVRISLTRLGDPAEIDQVTMGVIKRSEPLAQRACSFPKMSEEGFKILTDAELDAHLAKREKAVPQLVANGDRTELIINGKPIIPRIFKGPGKSVANQLAGVSVFSRRGFNIFTMGFGFGESHDPRFASNTGIWRPDGSCDVEKVRLRIREYLKRFPDGYFMLNFGVAPYNGWGERHPSEIYRNEQGGYGAFVGCRVKAFHDKPVFDYAKGEYPAVSYTSTVFAQAAADFIERLFAAIEDMPEGKAVIGAYCCGGTDGQWLDLFDNHVSVKQAADYSDVARRRFAEFRRRKYGRDDIDVRIPSVDAIWDRTNQFYAVHTSTSQSDYFEFLARATTQFRLTLAKGIKRGSKGRVLVGSYSPAGGLEGFPLISATYTKGLLTSPDYDFFAVVPNYMREHVDPVIAAIYDGSCLNRSKLYISELDLRSGDVRNWGFWGSDFWAENHNAATFRRKALYFAANALTHGGAFHAYDMDGGWYATDASRAVWEKTNEMADHAHPMPLADERIALVGGERFYDFQSFGKNRVVPYFVREQPRTALCLSGVPWNQYLLEEVMASDGVKMPKVVIFTDLSTVSRQQFSELRQRYARDGRVLVYSWRPGMFAADGGRIEEELGLRPADRAYGKVGYADGQSKDPLMRGVSGMLIPSYPYYYIEYAPVVSPDPAAGWKTLANFAGTNIPALAVRREAGFTEVYTSFPGGITSQLCRNFVREAGLEPLLETDELSGYGSGIFYMVAQTDGDKRFRLPKGVVPDKVLEGPAFKKEGKGYVVRLRRGAIFVLAVK
jgi:hypothetical protein